MNVEFLNQKIKACFPSVEAFAASLGLSKQSVYNWINQKSVLEEDRLLDIFSALELSEPETEVLLGIPPTQVFFRKRGLQSPDKGVEERSKDLANTFFKLDGASYVVKDAFVTVGSKDPVAIASHIRSLLGAEAYKPICFNTLMLELRKHSINVFFLPFRRIGLVLSESGSREVAFTARKGNRAIIFSDTDRTKDQVTFDICHELSHLILGHETPTKEEERLCNQVATELIYPRKFFELNSDSIRAFVDAQGHSAFYAAEKFSQLSLEFDWSPMGLAIALKEYGLIKDKSHEQKRLMTLERFLAEKRKTLDQLFYLKFSPEDYQTICEFFDFEIQKEKDLFKPLIELRDAAAFGRISPRRLAEILNIDSGDADELVRSWMKEKEAIASQDDARASAAT